MWARRCWGGWEVVAVNIETGKRLVRSRKAWAAVRGGCRHVGEGGGRVVLLVMTATLKVSQGGVSGKQL